MSRPIRIAIAALLLLATLHLDAPPPADGSIIPPHPYSTVWVGETTHAIVPLIWSIRQTESFTVTWDAGGNPIYARLNWSYCKIDSLGVTLVISWCGAYRTGSLSFDAGFDFVKSAFYIVGQQSCWVREKLWWTKGYTGPWRYWHRNAGSC